MKRAPFLLVLALALASSACSFGRSISPEAFRRGQAFAIVNVNSSERVMYTRRTMRVSPTGQAETGSYSVDVGPAAGLFPSTRSAALRTLASSPRFRFLPSEAVLSSGAYAAAPAQTKFFGGAKFIPAPGYKLVFDKPAIGRIARATGATAGFVLNLAHYYTGVGGGRYAGSVTVMVTAIDRSGKIIWTDFASALSRNTIGSETDRIAPAALEGLMVESTELGVREMLKRLDERLARRR
jgi:hypothetical protein